MDTDLIPLEDSTNSTKGAPGKPIGIPISTILAYKQKGYSNIDIAKLLNCDKSNITHRLKPYKQYIDSLEDYKSHRADTFATIQHILLDSIQPSDIKSMAPASRITSAAILYDKERLERDKSTENIAFKDIVQERKSLEEHRDEVLQRRAELLRQIAEKEGKAPE